MQPTLDTEMRVQLVIDNHKVESAEILVVPVRSPETICCRQRDVFGTRLDREKSGPKLTTEAPTLMFGVASYSNPRSTLKTDPR